MADLAASNITVTLVKQQLLRGSPGAQRRNLVKIEFGDGALTYPTGGVPMPVAAKFGMLKTLSYLAPIESGGAIDWRYNIATNVLKGWGGATETSGAVAAQALYYEAVGW